MRPSRGMGAIAPSKVPKLIKKRDGNEPVKVFKQGGEVKKFDGKDGSEVDTRKLNLKPRLDPEDIKSNENKSDFYFEPKLQPRFDADGDITIGNKTINAKGRAMYRIPVSPTSTVIPYIEGELGVGRKAKNRVSGAGIEYESPNITGGVHVKRGNITGEGKVSHDIPFLGGTLSPYVQGRVGAGRGATNKLDEVGVTWGRNFVTGGNVNKAGKQFVAQPKRIARKTAGYR